MAGGVGDDHDRRLDENKYQSKRSLKNMTTEKTL
jgi:hypothetical protein